MAVRSSLWALWNRQGMLLPTHPADLSYRLRRQRYLGSKGDQKTRHFSPENPRVCPTKACALRGLSKYGTNRVQVGVFVPGPVENTKKPRKECTFMAKYGQKSRKGACFHRKGAPTRRNRRPSVKIEFWASAWPLEAHSGLSGTAWVCPFHRHRLILVIM